MGEARLQGIKEGEGDAGGAGGTARMKPTSCSVVNRTELVRVEGVD